MVVLGFSLDNVVLSVLDKPSDNVRVSGVKLVNGVLENVVKSDADVLFTVTFAFDERLEVVVNVLTNGSELWSVELGVGFNFNAADKRISDVSFVNIKIIKQKCYF